MIYLYYFFRSVLLRGFINTARLLTAEMDYEKKFRINTSAIKKSSSSEFFHYQGAGYLVLWRIFSEIYKETQAFHFVDIGCGKGRVLFVAEHFGYNKITGIELDNDLVKEAQANLQLYPFKRPGSDIQILCENALTYAYKDYPTVYFLFNPFNEEILKRVLNRITETTHSETWFVYMNPLYARVFDEKGIERLKEIKTRFYKEAIVFRVGQRPLH